ncbi:hypothetical protein HS125_07865 [bacterium]|nr:hypothetical protein [bacterium]
MDTIALMSLVGDGEVGDWPVVVEDGRDRFPMRMIVIKKSAPAAECEREEIEKEARRKGRTPDPRSLRAAGYVMVVTDLAETGCRRHRRWSCTASAGRSRWSSSA